MNLLYVITKGEIGGAQRHVLDVAREMKGRGHKVSILVGKEGDWLIGEASRYGVEIITCRQLKRSWNPINMLRYGMFLRGFVREKKPDIVHFHSSNAIVGARLLPSRVKRVATVHGWSILHPGWKKSRIIKFLYKHFLRFGLGAMNKVIFVCRADAQLNEAFLVTRKPSIVVHNGIEEVEPYSRERAREWIGVSLDTMLIGTVARPSYAKHLGLFYEIAQRCSEAKFINLAEFKEEAPKLLGALDVFLLTSRFEGLPYAILEAGSVGLPVVSADVGGISEIIEDGNSGVLIRDADAKKYIEALKKLCEDKDRRESIGNSLKETVKKRFSRKKMSDKLEGVYATL